MGQKVGCIYSLLTRLFVHLPSSLSLLALAFCLVSPSRAYAQATIQPESRSPSAAEEQQRLPQGASIQGAVWHDLDGDGLLTSRVNENLSFIPTVNSASHSAEEYGSHLSQSIELGSAPNQPAQSRLTIDRYTGEPPVSGVDVALFRVNTSRPSQANERHSAAVVEVLDLVTTVTTTISGTFAFTDLAPGDYVVEFGQEGIQAGHRITEQRSSEASAPARGSTVVSNVEPTTRRGPRITVAGDDSLYAVNMGIWFPVSVGNRVWFDDDGNGIQDPDEQGVPNVGVSLFTIGDNGVLSYTEQSTQTDDEGFYIFGDLAPAIYLVEFDLIELPETYRLTLPDSGTDDALDSDASSRSAASAPTAFLESGTADSTLDLGLTTAVEIGDKVWVDSDLDGYQDESEVGLGGVEISLYDESGELRGGTISDRAGWYLFEGILPGTYYIAVQLPSNRAFSPQGVGRYAAADSDIDPRTGESALITLRAGDSASDLDIGLSEVAPIGVEQVQHRLFVPLLQ